MKRRKAPQVFPCIDCGGTGTRTETLFDDARETLSQRTVPCERCDGEGIEP